MERFISVVIPSYNRADFIVLCLAAISKSNYSNFEIIVVDDSSNNDTVKVIKECRYKCKLIRPEENKGAATARNIGAEVAKGEILLFTDSDVCLKEDTLALINQTFDKVPEASAVVGLPDKYCVFSNLTSQHFNLRVHHNYTKLPEFITTLYTTISAVKREAFFDAKGFNLNLKETAVEDPELGLRLSEKGYKIYFNKNISVIHHKHITFLELLKNDAKRTKARAKLMVERKMFKSTVKDKRYLTTPFSQIVSALLAPTILLAYIGSFFDSNFTLFTGMLLTYFWLLNYEYLRFVRKEKGNWLTFQLYWLLLVDMFVVGITLIWNLPKYVLRSKIKCIL